MTSFSDPGLATLARALDQATAVLGQVREEHLDLPTPCTEWTVGQLAGHLIADCGTFGQMLAGEQPDWTAEPTPATAEAATEFRTAADGLLAAWQQAGPDVGQSPDWQTAEFATHTWDLVQAIGGSGSSLDPQVATTGLDFVQANLGDEVRGNAFGPAQPAPADADPYTRLAAFTGRKP